MLRESRVTIAARWRLRRAITYHPKSIVGEAQRMQMDWHDLDVAKRKTEMKRATSFAMK